MNSRILQACLACFLVCTGSLPAAQSLPARNPWPPFSLQQDGANWWLVSPEGQKFFSLGVCVTTQGTPRDQFDPENPGYAAWQHFETPAAWADETLRRLKSWGFTTIGGWSDFSTLRQSSGQTLWLTPVLHIGSTAGAPWWDMWDPKNIRRMENVARDQILPLRNDPRLLGYYSDNELGWWNATLWKMTLEQAPSSGQRQRLIRLLRQTYNNDWSKLLQDFEPENAANWAQLQRGGMLYLKSGGQGIHTQRKFLGMLADRYYQLMRETIRKFDTRGLFLGDRYQSFYYPEVVQACARHADAVSMNLNAAWLDGTFPRFHFDTLQALTRKPILVTEFYLAAKENRTGNRNSHGIYPVVGTQPERARAAQRTLMDLLRLPYIVGADWFQFFDEPKHGREDGENFNFGLVDIHNHPYEELTAMFAALDTEQIKAAPPLARADASSGVPRAPAEPFAQFEPLRALQHWDRERGFVKPASPVPLADLYLCWKPEAVYLGLFALDIVEAAYYRGASVPKADRALWTVRINGQEPVRARIGAGRESLVSNPAVRVENLSGLSHNVRNIAAMELPANLFGKERLARGDEIELFVSLVTHAQAYRFEWSGKFTLAD